MDFHVESRDGQARAGLLRLPHGEVPTPVFMPVGTQATVKTVSQRELQEMGARIILGNAYHLYLRPGLDVMAAMGGLRRLMNWPHNLLTDSGGFQVFSLARIRRINDDGVTFQSHIDGSTHFLSPERVMEIEQCIGADIIMALDECVEGQAPREKVREALERTTAWAKRCVAHVKLLNISEQSLFGIVQGGIFEDLRRESARQLLELDLPGYAVGGLSVGEERQAMYDMLEVMDQELPTARPRYLMGVGVPEDILEAISRGVDMFDCVFPTRAARHSTVFSSRGKIHLKNAGYKLSQDPIDQECQCYTCRNHSLGYLRHLFAAQEMLGYRLASIHNLHFLLELTSRAREAILQGRFAAYKTQFLENYRQGL